MHLYSFFFFFKYNPISFGLYLKYKLKEKQQRYPWKGLKMYFSTNFMFLPEM